MMRPAGLLILLAAFVALALGVAGNRFLAFVVAVTMLNILWASGMNLLYGFAGLMPLTYA